MAEGRGKAQADSLRKAKTETTAHRITGDSGDPSNGYKRFTTEEISAPRLRKDDLVFVRAGEFIPGDGEIVEGVASVDESAITGDGVKHDNRGLMPAVVVFSASCRRPVGQSEGSYRR